MPKHVLNWKDVKTKNIRGADVYTGCPQALEACYRGTLLTCILAMPRKKPISFEHGIHLITAAMLDAIRARDIDRQLWLHPNFVSWISEQGFHIEICGDEFEPYLISDKLI